MRMLLVAMAMLSGSVMASTDNFVLGLFRLERCAFMSASETAKPERVDVCRSILADVERDFSALPSSASMAGSWRELVGLYEGGFENIMVFRDPYAYNDIRMIRQSMIDEMGDKIPVPPNPIALAVLIERAATEYIWRAESTAVTVMAGSGVLDIESLAHEIDEQFSVLRKAMPRDVNVRYAFSRYHFIRKSLLEYNKDTVPFLIDLYSSDITDALRKIEVKP